jgi:hypothetical protein
LERQWHRIGRPFELAQRSLANVEIAVGQSHDYRGACHQEDNNAGGDAQRSLDAQSTVIGLRADLLTNRVALYRALGGDFAPIKASSGTATALPPVAAPPSTPSAILSGDQDA